MRDRKKAMHKIFMTHGFKDKTPFGFTDRIREMKDEEYASLKDSIRQKNAADCCQKNISLSKWMVTT